MIPFNPGRYADYVLPPLLQKDCNDLLSRLQEVEYKKLLYIERNKHRLHFIIESIYEMLPVRFVTAAVEKNRNVRYIWDWVDLIGEQITETKSERKPFHVDALPEGLNPFEWLIFLLDFYHLCLTYEMFRSQFLPASIDTIIAIRYLPLQLPIWTKYDVDDKKLHLVEEYQPDVIKEKYPFEAQVRGKMKIFNKKYMRYAMKYSAHDVSIWLAYPLWALGEPSRYYAEQNGWV